MAVASTRSSSSTSLDSSLRGSSEERSLLPWLDESSIEPLLPPPTDPLDTTQDPPPSSSLCLEVPYNASISTSAGSVLLPESPLASFAHSTPPTRHLASSHPPDDTLSLSITESFALAPTESPFVGPPPRDIEAELRATVDALLKRKKAVQSGLVEENASLREEVAFLRNTLRLASADSDITTTRSESEPHSSNGSNKAKLAASLAQERTQRLRSEEKLNALVEYLAEQIANVSERAKCAENALNTSERDCVSWRDKAVATSAQCEVLEEENFRVKALLHVFARQMPTPIQQHVDAMLREVAEERANLKSLEAIEQSIAKLDAVPARTTVRKTGTLNARKYGTKKTKVYDDTPILYDGTYGLQSVMS
ncbi:hypothetical protein GY45DRAFT_405271 [Cubamyces sp. BRFM 1775]|nr:hypothetical protein GY45DRAFT_405271 [Cubamyces sp. BRFM 1775]